MKKFILFISLILVVGCSTTINEKISDDLVFRTLLLYEHTLLMEEYSTPEMLQEIKLDMSKIDNYEQITPEDQITQMALAYDMQLYGNYEEQITQLETRMDEMMTEWAKIQDYT